MAKRDGWLFVVEEKIAHKKAPHCGAFLNLAVGEGFEPSIRFRIHTFQACSFGHSDTPP